MAIPMPIVQDIRRLDRQGMSRAQIARRLHVDRGTVAKYADMEDCSPKPKADRGYGVVGTFHGVELVVVRAARDADHGQQASGGHAELLTGLFDEDGLPAAGQVFRDCARLFPQQLQRPTADRDLDVRFPLLPPLPLDVGVQLVQAGPCPRRPLLFLFNRKLRF